MDVETANNIIDEAILSKLVKGEEIVIGDEEALSSVPYMKDVYIPRTLCRPSIKKRILTKEDIWPIFITGACEEDLINLGAKKGHIHVWTGDGTPKNGIVLHSSAQGDKRKILEYIYQQTKKDVHWLMYCDNKLFYLASYRDSSFIHSDKLNKYTNNGYSRKEKEIWRKPDSNEKVVIIANDPGAGKSTLLTSVALQMKQEHALWVVRVNLNDFAVEKDKEGSLHNVSFEEDDTVKAIEFVSLMAVPSNDKNTSVDFQRKFFKEGFKNSKIKIVILLDGFDEISPDFKKRTTTLIKALKRSEATQLWVTTRVHHKLHLATELESPPYILNPLTEKKQDNFLNEFWRWSFKSSEDIRKHLLESHENIKELFEKPNLSNKNKKILEVLSKKIVDILDVSKNPETLRKVLDEKDEKKNYKLDFSDCAKLMLQQWSKELSDTNKEFNIVPLNIRMLAEVVFEKKFQLLEKLKLFNLYEEFKKLKFKIYNHDKAEGPRGNQASDIKDLSYENKMNKIHCELALKELLGKKKSSLPGQGKMEKFKKFALKHGKDGEEEIVRAGLVTFLSDGNPRFVHRSYAEYFLSEYLIRNLQNEEVQKLLLNEILVENNYVLIRKFFNGQLEKYSLADIDLTVSANNNTFLYCVSEEGHFAIVKFLLDKLKDPLTLKMLMKPPDGKIPILQLTVQKKYTKTVRALLEGLKNYSDILKDIVQAKKTELHMLFPYTKTVKVMLNWFKENYPDILSVLVLLKDIKHQTELLKVMKNIDMFEDRIEDVNNFLKDIKSKPDILSNLMLAADNDKQTVLYSAIETQNTELVKVLLDGVTNNSQSILKHIVLATDSCKCTVLHSITLKTVGTLFHWLMANNHLDILEELVLARDKNGYTALHTSIVRIAHKSRLFPDYEQVINLLRSLDSSTQNKLVLATDNEERTALHLIVAFKLTELLKKFLDCVKQSNSDTLQKLILAKDKDGNQVLHWAVLHTNKYSIANTIEIDIGHPNCSFKCYNYLVKDLLKCVKEYFPHTYKKVLEDMLTRNRDGKTPLHLAVIHDNFIFFESLLTWLDDYHPEIIIKLLKTTDSSENTAVPYNMDGIYSFVDKCKNFQTVKILFKWVNDILPDYFKEGVLKVLNYMSKDQSILHSAALRCDKLTVMALLDWVNDSLDPQSVAEALQELVHREDNWTRAVILYWAVHNNHRETLTAILEWLKQYEQDLAAKLKELVSARSKDGCTILHWAAAFSVEKERGIDEDNHECDHNTFKKLSKWLEKNMNKDAASTLEKLALKINSNRQTPLHVAMLHGPLHLTCGHVKTYVWCKFDTENQPSLYLDIKGTKKLNVKPLLDWVKERHLRILEDLMLASDSEERTALHAAIAEDNEDGVKALLDWVKENCPSILEKLVLTPDTRGQSALHLTIYLARVRIFQELLEAIRSLSGRFKLLALIDDYDKQTILHIAARHNKRTIDVVLNWVKENHDDIIRKLLLVAKQSKGVPPMIHALLDAVREKEIFKQLVQATSDTLHEVMRSSKEAIVAMLQVAYVNIQDHNQQTALHIAANSYCGVAVQALLQAQASVNVQDSKKQTALHIAANSGCGDTVQALLQAQASVNVQDSKKQTALHIAVNSKWARLTQSSRRVQALLQAHASVNAQDHNQQIPLHLITGQRDVMDVVKLLLNAGADIYITDINGNTPADITHKTDRSGRVIIK